MPCIHAAGIILSPSLGNVGVFSLVLVTPNTAKLSKAESGLQEL